MDLVLFHGHNGNSLQTVSICEGSTAKSMTGREIEVSVSAVMVG